jgi:hypothetical protein
MFLSSFSLPFLLILYFWFFCCVDINVAEIEARANEILRSISAKEDAKIQENLGGTETIVSSYFVVFMLVIVWLPLAAALRKQSIWLGQGSSEAAATSVHSKTIKKRHDHGTGRNVSKRRKTSRAVTSEVVSSSPEESDHSKSDVDKNPPRGCYWLWYEH